MKGFLPTLLLLALSPVCHAGIAVSANSNGYSYYIATMPGSITGHPGIPFFYDALSGALSSFTHNETTGTLTSTDPSYVFTQSLTNNVTANLATDGTYSLTLHEVNNFSGTQTTATNYANLINSFYAGHVPTAQFSQSFQLTTDVPQQYRIQATDSQTGVSPFEQVEVDQDGSFFAFASAGSSDQTLTLSPGHTYLVQLLGFANNDAFTGRNDGITNVGADMSVTMTPGAIVPEPSALTILGLSALTMLRRPSRSCRR